MESEMEWPLLADDNLEYISFHDGCCILIQFSLKFIRKANICLDDYLPLNRRQAITWLNQWSFLDAYIVGLNEFVY